ncbi:uncharacterized protein BYT42DRAFT_604832 [Radiomyces spectabilis]|uniref:uncharacterized protein n=1 Tax=Radiomyces spectabilis TaxID=64574 RepID=UPI00221F671D|nr:uncharacterized protein BYT42DRAFT_604832 [Radiomyces spectabilis]KAI8379465.1 hypothetical protein BYT42DRAFT_604832 [Radiomyces spectabilis]
MSLPNSACHESKVRPAQTANTYYDPRQANTELPFLSIDFRRSITMRSDVTCPLDKRHALLKRSQGIINSVLAIPHGTADGIHERCVSEVYRFCVENELADAWAYLYRNWICTCPAFAHNRFLLCKHLVAQRGYGQIAPRQSLFCVSPAPLLFVVCSRMRMFSKH